MPDITMCVNFLCPRADECYRAKAKASEYRSASYYKPRDNGECERFLPMKERKNAD